VRDGRPGGPAGPAVSACQSPLRLDGPRSGGRWADGREVPGNTPPEEVCGAVEVDTGADGSADTVGAVPVPRLCLNGVSS
jgi:hypothetical protein